ncbi:unnamed protein product [Somion occarium]|uniref:Peroxisomal biogenesis factor 3 n=2 Tax=Somion occarium TaxID=3059160 RepID=A0ABP1DSV4_9APHY
MLHAVVNFFRERKHGLTRTATYLGGAYLAGRYVVGQLEEVREKVMQERLARENLRRRFEQNQQDTLFTIMALLPTLGGLILDGMDVEENVALPQLPRAAPQDGQEHDTRSENGSVSVISAPGQEDSATSSELAASSNSWVDQFSSVASSQGLNNQTPSSADSNARSESPKSNVGSNLSDSIMTDSSAVSYDNALVQPTGQPTLQVPKTKAELWREVKMLTFTRTLTILYSTTLLSLFTHIQLSILGRSKYIQSIVQLAHDERMREQWQDSMSLTSLLWGGSDMEGLPTEDDMQEVEVITEETERKYLTLSWWILHVGWKDVGERVRKGVEEVFESVSLKTKFSANELFGLVSDVRRRVEFEVTFEGKERRINFASTLLPPTPETLHHVLLQGGIPSRQASAPDATFQSLLAETRTHLTSASFERVLEVCLDRATDMLFDDLEKNVFHENEPKSGITGWEEATASLGPETKVRLAGMLPGLARWCHSAVEGLPNELVDGLGSVREVNAFSAIIYSSYEDRFR